jgi:hypothetical protein
MKKVTASGILAASVLASAASGCQLLPNQQNYDPENNIIEAVYGPPEDFEEAPVDVPEPQENESE